MGLLTSVAVRLPRGLFGEASAKALYRDKSEMSLVVFYSILYLVSQLILILTGYSLQNPMLQAH